MRNRKLNKSILTGLAAVTLFAPMVLHNTQANAADSSQTSQVRTALQKDSFRNLTIQGSKNLDPSQMNENDVNNIFDSLKSFASSYQNLPNNLKSSQTAQFQQLLKDTNNNDLSSVPDNNAQSTASAINQLAGDVNNAVNSSSDSSSQPNKESQIKTTLGKYGNQNVQLMDGTKLSDKNISHMNDTDIDSLADQISNFNTSYNNAQSNINNNNKAQMQAVVKSGDIDNSQMSYDDANNLANTLNSLNTSVQGTLNQSGESSKPDPNKAADVQETLEKYNPQSTNLVGASKMDVTQLKPNQSNKDISTIFGIVNQLSNFASNYSTTQSNMKGYQTNQLKSLFTNNVFSNADSDYGTVSQAANDLNDLSTYYNGHKPNTSGSQPSKEDNIRGALSRDNSQYNTYKNSNNANTSLSNEDADALAGKLSQFSAKYSGINNISSSDKFSTLKSLNSSVDGNDQSGRSVDDVINTGIALNNAANDVIGIKSVSSKGTMELQKFMNHYNIKTLNFGGNNNVTSDKVSADTANNINSIQGVTFNNSKQSSLTFHNSGGINGLSSSIRNSFKQAKDKSSADANTKNANNIKAIQDIMTKYHAQTLNFDGNNKITTDKVSSDTVNNINSVNSVTFNDSKNTTLGLSHINGIKGLSSSIRNALQQSQTNSAKNTSNNTRNLQNIMNKYGVKTINFSNNVNISVDKVNAGIADNINTIQSITLNDNKATTLGLHNNNGLRSLSSNVRGAIQQNQQAAQSSNTASGGSVVTTTSNTNENNNSSSNSSNNTSNNSTNNSQEASFPAAPTTKKSSSHQTTKESKKTLIKDAKKDKSNIKSNQKQLDKVKKQLKKAKGKNNKAKANKELKQAEKALAHSENQYNHDKKSLK